MTTDEVLNDAPKGPAHSPASKYSCTSDIGYSASSFVLFEGVLADTELMAEEGGAASKKSTGNSGFNVIVPIVMSSSVAIAL